jgi:hypothetical protein
MHKIIIFLIALSLSSAAFASDNLNAQLISRIASSGVEDVKILLERGADANAKNSVNRPAIVVAAGRKHPDAVKIIYELLKKGANPDASDSRGQNAFVAAISYGTPESVAYLLQLKPSYKMQNSYGDDLPKIAINRGDKQIIALVEKLKNDEIIEYTRLTSSQNRQKLFKDFAFKACAEEYMIFYYSNEHEAEPDMDKYDNIMTRLALELQQVLSDMKKYFDLSRAELSGIEERSRKTISNDLAEMGSSNYRVRAGVGKNADLQKRCGKIARDISLRTNIKRKVVR